MCFSCVLFHYYEIMYRSVSKKVSIVNQTFCFVFCVLFNFGRKSLIPLYTYICRVPVLNNNEETGNKEHFRLWKRDLAACLNMLHIVRPIHENGQISEGFRHNAPQ